MKPRYIWGGLNICVVAAAPAPRRRRRRICLLPICVPLFWLVGILATGTCAVTIADPFPDSASKTTTTISFVTTKRTPEERAQNEAGPTAMAADASVTSSTWIQQQQQQQASDRRPATTTTTNAALPLQSEVAHRWWVDRRHEKTHSKYTTPTYYHHHNCRHIYSGLRMSVALFYVCQRCACTWRNGIIVSTLISGTHVRYCRFKMVYYIIKWGAEMWPVFVSHCVRLPLILTPNFSAARIGNINRASSGKFTLMINCARCDIKPEAIARAIQNAIYAMWH